MAADETDSPSGSSERVRSGKPSREPPVIEAEAVEVVSEVPPQDATGTAPEAGPAAAPEPELPQAQPAAASREGRSPLPLAIALLLGVSGLGLAAYGWLDNRKTAAALAAFQDEVAGQHAQPPAITPEQLIAIEKRLEALEKRPAPFTVAPATAPATAGEAVAGLAARIDTLDRRLAGLTPAGQTEALETRLATLEHGMREAAAAASPALPPVDLAPLTARMAGLDTRLAALEAEMRVAKTEVRAREAPLEAASKRGDAAGLAVVAQAILQAVDRGTPFSADLNIAESLGADPVRLVALRAVADKGAPGVAGLAAAWAGQRRAALGASVAVPGEDQGLLDRLAASAARLVRVRPAGEVAGDDPGALAARIDAALARGSISEALAAWDRLPAAAKAASAAFGDPARRRVAADEAARTLAAAAVADLARPKGAQ